jgi:hypothetical protein
MALDSPRSINLSKIILLSRAARASAEAPPHTAAVRVQSGEALHQFGSLAAHVNEGCVV